MAKRNSQYSILFDVLFNTKQVQDALKEAFKIPSLKLNQKETSKVLENVEKEAKEAAKALRETKEAGDEASITFNVANEIFRDTVDVIKAMASEVLKLDSAMTEMQKVANLSGDALEEYADQLSDIGRTVGRTREEMINASTEFIKSGYSEEEAAVLAQVATLYQNISDEAISAGESANMIISQLIAFNLTANDAMTVIDQINEVSNRFAVSSADLANNLGIVSSTSAAMGNSLSETIGIINH